MKPKVVCLVGHENWGKSETLYYLVGESRHKGWLAINDIDIFVRHISNDDRPNSFIDFITNVKVDNKPCLITALCPNFTNPEARTEYILKTVRKKGYKLYFWVLYNQYGKSDVINTEDINRLQQYGEVEVYKGKSEAPARAKILKTYISKILNA